MTFRNLSIISVIAIIFGCNSKQESRHQIGKTQQTPDISIAEKAIYKVDTVANSKYAFIVGNIQKGDSCFIDADYIQYLTGQAAIDAAIKRHEADTFQTEDGKTHVDVPNDYFIVNDNKKIRRLLLAKSCLIDLVINPDGIPPINDNSFQSLKKVDNESPFLLTFNDKGVVIKIKEIFVP